MIRKPGQHLTLTDEELVASPARLLSPEQRKRRRRLKNNLAKEKSRAARKRRLDTGTPKILYCQGYTKAGNPCGSYAVSGAKHCIAHMNEAECAKLGVKKPQKGQRVKEPLVKSAPKLMRLVVEAANEKIIYRYFKALGLELKGFDEEGNPIIEDHGMEWGVCLHGESKEGYVHVSTYPDLMAQITVLEKLMDRTYGRPKQTTVLEGGERPVQVQPVKSEDRAKQVTDILRRAHAVGHEGRSRRAPSEDADHVPDNVTPLNDN